MALKIDKKHYAVFLKIPLKYQIYLISLLIGVISAVAAFALKNSVHYLHHWVTEESSVSNSNLLLLAMPVVGIFITWLFVKYVVKDDIGHGVTKILYAISKNNGRIKRHNQWTSVIASSITIGFGGSVGAEAPIVLTGAAIGSNLGRRFNLDHKTLFLLIGCGASGAIAAIFKAPIAGLVFTLEVLMLDLTMASLVPLLISAVTAASLSYFIMGRDVLFNFTLVDPFVFKAIPLIILLGVLCGFVSLYVTRGVNGTEGRLIKIQNPLNRLLFGGLTLSLLIYLFPPLYGEGYYTITALMHGDTASVFGQSIFYGLKDNPWVILGYLFLVLMFKVVATSMTNGAGGVGGIFAPTLFMGGITGFIVARFFNLLGFHFSESNFTLVGMAGLMAGVMHAPLTAIFLIAEITSGYGLILPLMLVSVVSYITIMYFEPHSIYHKRLAKKGQLITHHKDKAVLTLLKLRSVIETDFDTVLPGVTLGELVKTIAQSKRNLFPVTDQWGYLKGIVVLDDIRNIMFRPELYEKFRVRDLMIQPPGFVSPENSMEEVMNVFEKTGAWNLPVVDNGKYIGFVSKSKIFNSYRKVLVHYSDE